MKTLTSNEAYSKIKKVLEYFHKEILLRDIMSLPNQKMFTSIPNVGMCEMVALFNFLGTENKRLFMPDELDGENIVIIYKPCEGCVIEIVSEKVYKVEIDKVCLN